MNVGIRLALVLVLCPQALVAQGLFDQFSYEGLRFSGIGIEIGGIVSNRITSELSGAVRIDYGLIAPKVRVLLGVSYFKGDFKDDEIDQFERQLRGVVSDPTGDFTIDVGTVSWSDIEADLDLQYILDAGVRLQGFVGVGIAAHVRNGSGAAIEGTFVEDALDAVEAGVNASIGLQVMMARGIYLTADARGGVTSELRTAAARVGLMYRVQR